MFKTAKIAEKTIYKEFRVHHDFDLHKSLRYVNVYYYYYYIPKRLTLELQCHSYSWSNVRRNVIHAMAAKTVF